MIDTEVLLKLVVAGNACKVKYGKLQCFQIKQAHQTPHIK